MSEPKYNARVCPVCGKDDFQWGVAHGQMNRDDIAFFRPNDARWHESGEVLHARKCTTCGNVQLFSRTSAIVNSQEYEQKSEKRKRKNDQP